MTAALWVVRWLIIVPLNWIVAELAPRTARAAVFDISGSALSLLLLLVLVMPLVETLLECLLPHWILSKITRRMHRGGLFIFVSASLMAILHLVSLLAVVNAFITGAFIASVYWHAHRRGHGAAILHATVFHAAINLVGWVMLVVSRHGT